MIPTIRKILLPTDFGPSSPAAAAYAGALARELGGSVHLVHVRPQRVGDGIRQFQNPSLAAADDQHYHECREKLAALATTTVQHATDRFTLEVRTGTPWKAIVDAAVDYGADLIVMSAPRDIGAPNLVRGSVADQVIRAAPCPVLAISQSGAARVHNPTRAA